jgi:general L-amino acid transport system permease protein
MVMAPHDDLAPPVASIGVIGWLRKNLFSNWFNSILSLVSLWFLVTVGGDFVRWAIMGAKWSVVYTNLRLFMVGPYPPDQVWRVWLVLASVCLVFGMAGGVFGGTIRQFAVALAATLAGLALLPFELVGRGWLLGNVVVLVVGYSVARGRESLRPWLVLLSLATFAASILLLQGFEGNSIMPAVSTSQWGGLLLTFVLTVVSIVVSFPLGVLLALGRRSPVSTRRRAHRQRCTGHGRNDVLHGCLHRGECARRIAGGSRRAGGGRQRARSKQHPYDSLDRVAASAPNGHSSLGWPVH